MYFITIESPLSDNETIFFIQSTFLSQHAEQDLALYSVAFELQKISCLYWTNPNKILAAAIMFC